MAENPNMTVVRDYALKNNITPTGRKLGISKVANTALYRVSYVDDRPGRLPDSLGDDKWTRPEYAQEALQAYLVKMWDESDAAAAKSVSKAQAEAVATQRMIEALDPVKKAANAAATA